MIRKYNNKKILILGNLGYIGPVLTKNLRVNYTDAELIGFDTGFFEGCLLKPEFCYDRFLSSQVYGDIRSFNNSLLKNVDTVICLAAVSNDPIGNVYEKQTLEINANSTIRIAQEAKKAGVKNFIFASSCSVYGVTDEGAKNEQASLNPLTAYSKSKIICENGLNELSSDSFQITCLRFATACGYSPRLRLDLVLNDFVASALINNKIELLSDGTSWRPIIDVEDMSRAIEWAIIRDSKNNNFLALNIGKDDWNFTIRELAESVKNVIPNVDLSFARDASPDKRSYKVDFSLFESLAPNHQPIKKIDETIKEIADGIKISEFRNPNFRESYLSRLSTLKYLTSRNLINSNLEWNS